jgi:hypothetical protein
MKTLLALLFCVMTFLSPAPLVAQQPPPGTGSPSVEKKLKELPPASLFWRIENFPSLDQAQAAVGPTALVADFSGKVWLFTLGPQGGATPGATTVAEVGPLPPIQAPEYLLRIMNAKGPPGWRSPTHSHPGSEAFYVLKGRLGHRTPHGTHYADAATAMNSHGVDMPMEVFSAGDTDFEIFAMFVLDATRPFSSPARFE